MIDLRDADLSLLDFVPESIASDAEIIALSHAIDPELRAVGQAIIEAVILPRVSELPEEILDELAWAFRLNRLQIWDTATLAAKRALLVNIFAIRKKSGTRFAVRRVFGLLSIPGTVVEWWQEGAQPNTYRLRITVTDEPITQSQIIQVAELVRRFSRASQKLREFAIEAEPIAVTPSYVALAIGRQTTIPYGGP